MMLDESVILANVQNALDEDVGSGDVSAALIPADLQVQASIISREPMVVCGRPWVDAVFHQVNSDISIEWLVEEGSWQQQPTTLCRLRGQARSILTAERSALNFLQSLSATATKTYHYVQALLGSKTQLLDTRKTLPGLRYAQKYAVRCAGAHNHRMGLYDAFLIKENHIAAAGSIGRAIEAARRLNPSLLLEVEVETLDQLAEALRAQADRILLDNFSEESIQEAVVMNKGATRLEASGGIQLSNIRRIADLGVDYISIGDLTKSLQAIDLSLGIEG
jgi:nicotinate-nucleotide pyrophosphorylase (carboxylating)